MHYNNSHELEFIKSFSDTYNQNIDFQIVFLEMANKKFTFELGTSKYIIRKLDHHFGFVFQEFSDYQLGSGIGFKKIQNVWEFDGDFATLEAVKFLADNILSNIN